MADRARNTDPYADDDPGDNVDDLLAHFEDGQQGDNLGKDDEGREADHRPGVSIDDTQADDAPSDEYSIDPAPPAARRQGRQERRQDRGGLHDAFVGRGEENDRLRARVESLEGMAQRFQDQEHQEDASDELDDEMTAVETEIAGVTSQYNAALAARTLTKEQLEPMQAQARTLDAKLRKLQFRKFAKEEGYGPVASPEEQHRRAVHAQLSSSAPDIYADEDARALLAARYKVERRKGAPDGMALHDRLCAEVRDELSMPHQGRRPAPTEQQRRATSGSPRGGGARSAKATRSIRMTDERRHMADLAYPHIEDEVKRHKTWAVEVGAVLVKNGEA